VTPDILRKLSGLQGTALTLQAIAFLYWPAVPKMVVAVPLWPWPFSPWPCAFPSAVCHTALVPGQQQGGGVCWGCACGVPVVCPGACLRCTPAASQLSPKKWGPLAPLASIAVFSALVNNGVDVRPLALVLLVGGILDAVYLGGAAQAQVLSLWPGYRNRVLVHEAGHVLVGEQTHLFGTHGTHCTHCAHSAHGPHSTHGTHGTGTACSCTRPGTSSWVSAGTHGNHDTRSTHCTYGTHCTECIHGTRGTYGIQAAMPSGTAPAGPALLGAHCSL